MHSCKISISSNYVYSTIVAEMIFNTAVLEFEAIVLMSDGILKHASFKRKPHFHCSRRRKYKFSNCNHDRDIASRYLERDVNGQHSAPPINYHLKDSEDFNLTHLSVKCPLQPIRATQLAFLKLRLHT